MQQLMADEIAELLARLVDKSLVQVDANGRYGLLQLVHSFAQEELMRDGHSDVFRARHLTYFHNLSESLYDKVFSNAQVQAMADLADDLDNIRVAALRSCSDAQTWEMAVQIFDHLTYFVHTRGAYSEGISIGLPIIESAPENSDFVLAQAWAWLATLQQFQGNPEATASCKRAIELGEISGNKAAMSTAYRQLGLEKERDREFEESNALLTTALRLARESGDKRLQAPPLMDMGGTAFCEEKFEVALKCFQEARRIWQEVGHLRGMAIGSANIAAVLERFEDFEGAHRNELEAMRTFVAINDTHNLPTTLIGACNGYWLANDHVTAAMLLGCADVIWEGIEGFIDQGDAITRERWSARLRSAMGDESYVAAFEEGRRTPWKTMAELVLSNPEPWNV